MCTQAEYLRCAEIRRVLYRIGKTGAGVTGAGMTGARATCTN